MMSNYELLQEKTSVLYNALRARVIQRPLLAALIGGVLLLWSAAACVAQVRHAMQARSSATHNAPFNREQAEAYRRYQDYEYVKRTGPITGPWYSSKW